MAGRTFLTPGEVPELRGDPREDLRRLREFLVLAMEELEFKLGVILREIEERQE